MATDKPDDQPVVRHYRLEAKDDESVWRALDMLGDSIERLEKSLPTAKELEGIRKIVERDTRVEWIWSTARTWTLWIAAVVTGFTIGVDALKAVLKRLVA
jgi:hypothetical protein